MDVDESSMTLCDQRLGEEDCYTILQELEAVAHRWYDIGLALGLRTSALDSIKSKGQGDVHELMRNMVIEWLKMSYNVERFGLPTWRRIVEAVMANSGGKNPALADTLARKYGVAVIQDSQPMKDPPTHIITKTHDEAKNSFICCCFGGRKKKTSQEQNKKGAKDQNLLLREQLTEDSVRFHRNFSNSSQSNPAAYSITQKRARSLPRDSILSCTEQDLSRDPKLEFEESGDATLAHATWKIREIVKQESYWGRITRAKAEDTLRRVGGNCYLIRYSERRQCYCISVMVRDDLQLQRLPKHFTLDIKKEGDHNIYEIEGTEERFTNVSELLDYYQKNPLTTEKFTTLGKPCNKPTLGLI